MSRFLTWPLLIWVGMGQHFFSCVIWLGYHLDVLLGGLFLGYLAIERTFLLGPSVAAPVGVSKYPTYSSLSLSYEAKEVISVLFLGF